MTALDSAMTAIVNAVALGYLGGLAFALLVGLIRRGGR